MINQRPRFLSITMAVILVVLSAGPPAFAQTTGTEKTITLGLVSIVFHKEIEEHFSDFMRYVARRLSTTSAREGKVVVASTAPQLAKLLEEKKVDFYMESPYPTFLINKQGAAVLLLRRWKGGMAEYRSLLFTGKNRGIKRLEDLRGKLIAFEDAGSTSGYFLPKVLLIKKGFKVTEKPRPDARVTANEIGYFFALPDHTAIDLVLAKTVAAGAFSDDDYGSLDAARKAAITILAESEALPRHLVSTRKNLDASVKNRLAEILLSMDKDTEGRKILRQTDNTTKFDRLPGGEESVRRRIMELFRPYGKS